MVGEEPNRQEAVKGLSPKKLDSCAVKSVRLPNRKGLNHGNS